MGHDRGHRRHRLAAARRSCHGGQTLKLDRGSPLPNVATPTMLNVFVPGPHGGLTVIHGGGNLPLSIDFDS